MKTIQYKKVYDTFSCDTVGDLCDITSDDSSGLREINSNSASGLFIHFVRIVLHLRDYMIIVWITLYFL